MSVSSLLFVYKHATLFRDQEPITWSLHLPYIIESTFAHIFLSLDQFSPQASLNFQESTLYNVLHCVVLCCIVLYYMASSASGQDEPNRALWLATRAGKMEPSCPLGTTRCIPQVKFTKSHIINPLLTKFVRSRWLDIGLVLFLSRSINTQKKNLANIQPSWPHTWSITHTYCTV